MRSPILYVNNPVWEAHHAKFSSYSRLVRFIPPPIETADAVAWSGSRIGTTLFSINAHLRIWPLHFPFDLSELQWLRSSKGVIHHLYGEATCFLSPMLAAGRVIATFHLPPAELRRVESRLWKIVGEQLAAAVCLSERQAGFLRETLSARVEFIPHGIDVEAIGTRLGERRVGQRYRHCVFVGNYLRDFEALERVIRALDAGTTVSVVSSAADAARLDRHLQSNPAKARVHFHSGLADDNFLELLRRADVFLLGLTDGTANNALLEAMAAGLAVVSFGSYHPHEYLPEGAKVSDRDGEQAALEIERLFDNPQKLGEMQASSRSKAESLDWSRIVPRLVELYDSIGSSER